LRPLIAARDLRFRWHPAGPWLLVLDALTIEAGQSWFIRGPSGCGKSTLLGLIAGTLGASAGELEVNGRALNGLSARQRDRLRAETMGIIFQQFNLLPYLSVMENVMLVARFAPERRARAISTSGSVAADATRLLAHLGLGGYAEQPAHALSVGQQQRVAAARALLGRPSLVLADEPTSALDEDNRHTFIELLRQECAAAGSALLFVSHERSLADHFENHLDLPAINQAASLKP